MESLKRILIKRYAISLALLLALASVLLIFPLRAFFLEKEGERLEAEAKMLAKEYARLFDGGRSFEANDAYLKDAAAATPFRITLIDKNGRVIGDSRSNSRSMENHANRFEVDAALKGEVVSILRDSRTIEGQFLYAAAPAMIDSEIVGVARIAIEWDEIITVVGEMWLILFITFLLIIILVVLVSLKTTRMISGKLKRVSEAAEKLASGDFYERVPELKIAELTDLARSFNSMAGEIAKMLTASGEEGRGLKAILGSIGTGVVVTDSNHKIIIFNRAAERIFQVSEEAALGRRLIEVFPSNEFDSLLASASRFEGFDEEINLIYPKRISLRIRTTPLFDEQGNLSRMVAAIDDITKIKEIDKIRTDFAANVSHELRTPVASIKALSDSIKLARINDDLAATNKFLADLDAQVNGLTQLIEDLLSLSRLESKEAALKVDQFNLLELVESAVSAKIELAKENGVEIEVDKSSWRGRVKADRTLIAAALSNLLDNAIKYNKPGGKVTVRAALEGDHFSITVADTGIGIGREELSRIFERFYRVDRARSKETGGTGLGASIVKHVTELHGGWLEAESVQAVGSTFTIKIPLNRQFT